MIEKIKRIYRFYFKSQPKFRISYKTKAERHGNVYGGWNILPNSLDENSIVYSFGIGEDISFDLSVIRNYSCKVFGYDPTPRVADFLDNQDLPTNFIFSPIGLSDSDGTLTFYTPEDETHISHKAFAGSSSQAVTVKCLSLKTIMKEKGHEKIDLLKIDIEGFEYPVLDKILEDKINIHQLLVEFHHFFPEVGNAKTENMIRKLELHGYRLFSVSDSFCEYSFINIDFSK